MFNKFEQKTIPGCAGYEEQAVTCEGLKKELGGSDDIVFNRIAVNNAGKLRITVVFVDGTVDTDLADNVVLKPLAISDVFHEARSEQDVIDLIMSGRIYHYKHRKRKKLCDCIDDILSGCIALIFDETQQAVTFEMKGYEKRAVTEPTNENVLKGSKESFVESFSVNTALVRRRLQTKDLRVVRMDIGERAKTAIGIIYLDGVANRNTLSEIRQRLGGIKMDGIISSGQIEAFLIDKPKSFFPQILFTERADKFCASILEGRIGIIIEGIPQAYITPVDINSFLQAPEDYALTFTASSVFRLLRYICAFVALVTPAVYVSILTFHQEMLPSKLVNSIVASKQGVPFPSFIEVMLMLLAFEVLLEAGLRLPRAIGQTVSIVGAVVVGQAAISAKILSPSVVITIAAAGISGFVVPSQDLSNAIRFCRVFLVLCSIVAGLYGVVAGLIAILYHLCSIELFGTPYMSPFVASEGKEMFNDTMIRRYWRKLKKRPGNIDPADNVRQGS
ncbi:MAG: spore germination protein [Clostridiales bacterium]|jgi:spore germination protein KA|nr:spore germination protein [Clostridiales bacterium]